MKATFVTMSKYHHPLPCNTNVGRQPQAGRNTQAETCLGAQRSGLRFLENSSHSIACMFPRLRTCKISVSWLVRILPLPDTAALGKSPGVPRVLAVPRTALGTWDPAPA